MIRILASLFLLGVVPAGSPAPGRLPGIELLAVRAPAVLQSLRLPPVSASGLTLIDLTSGEEILSKDGDEARPIASLTKIMAATIVLADRKNALDEWVTIPPPAEHVGGSTIGLKQNQHVRLRDLLKAMLMQSANDAAYSIAIHHSGDTVRFVEAMNERAKSLGLAHTHFTNPAGLDDTAYASPKDIAWLTLSALRNPVFASIVSTRFATIRSREGVDYRLKNTNDLLHSSRKVYGVKTGTTDGARECLNVLFRENDRPYLLVLLGSAHRYRDATIVMNAVHGALRPGEGRQADSDTLDKTRQENSGG